MTRDEREFREVLQRHKDLEALDGDKSAIELLNRIAGQLNKALAENATLFAFINREMKMTATDKRLKQLKKTLSKINKP